MTVEKVTVGYCNERGLETQKSAPAVYRTGCFALHTVDITDAYSCTTFWREKYESENKLLFCCCVLFVPALVFVFLTHWGYMGVVS